MSNKYDSTYFVKWLFSQDDAWLSQNGEWKIIKRGFSNSMALEHIANTLLYLERTARDIYYERFNTRATTSTASSWLVTTKLYKAMKSELFTRIAT